MTKYLKKSTLKVCLLKANVLLKYFKTKVLFARNYCTYNFEKNYKIIFSGINRIFGKSRLNCYKNRTINLGLKK